MGEKPQQKEAGGTPLEAHRERKKSAKPPACHGMSSLQSSKTSPIPIFFLIPPALSLEGAKAALSGRRES